MRVPIQTHLPLQHTTVNMREPKWFWRIVAYPFHIAHLVIYRTAQMLGNFFGKIAHKIMVESIDVREPTQKEVDKFVKKELQRYGVHRSPQQQPSFYDDGNRDTLTGYL